MIIFQHIQSETNLFEIEITVDIQKNLVIKNVVKDNFKRRMQNKYKLLSNVCLKDFII